MGEAQCRKISPRIVEMKLHAARCDVENLSNILHCLAVGCPCETLSLPLRQRAVGLTGQPASDPGAHMRMVGETHHLQEILGSLNETVKSRAPIIRRQRERRELSLTGGNANRQ